MSSGLPSKAQDRLNNYGIVLIGLVGSVLLWVSVVALQAYYNRTAGDLETERNAEYKNRQVRDLRAQQLADLQESKHVNPQKRIVTIPIDSAKGLVLRDLRDQSPSLVPAVGAHDLPTVPAVWGRPQDQTTAPAQGAAPAQGGTPPAGGAAPAAPAGGAAPAGAAPAGAAPAGADAKQPPASAAPAPAAGADAKQPPAAAPARPAAPTPSKQAPSGQPSNP
jgi:hypothetical protein